MTSLATTDGAVKKIDFLIFFNSHWQCFAPARGLEPAGDPSCVGRLVVRYTVGCRPIKQETEGFDRNTDDPDEIGQNRQLFQNRNSNSHWYSRTSTVHSTEVLGSTVLKLWETKVMDILLLLIPHSTSK